ncbi:EamA family transporter [Dietzia aerolata]|uniref:EamA family transporter n=1 Tax=Dietzia aerolata TaxID=595984 RepID=UPI003637FBFE
MESPAREALRRNVGHLASVALVVMWSSGFVGAELGVRSGGTPLQLLGWRFTILAAMLLAVCLVLRVDLTDGRAWGRQAIIGLLSQAAFLYLIFEGVNNGVDGGLAALIASLQPLLVATVAGRILGSASRRSCGSAWCSALPALRWWSPATWATDPRSGGPTCSR